MDDRTVLEWLDATERRGRAVLQRIDEELRNLQGRVWMDDGLEQTHSERPSSPVVYVASNIDAHRWLHYFGLPQHEQVAGNFFEWSWAWARTWIEQTGMDGSFFFLEQPHPHQQVHSAASHWQPAEAAATGTGGFCGLQCLEQTATAAADSLGPELSQPLQAAPHSERRDGDSVCSGCAWCDDSGSERRDGDSVCSGCASCDDSGEESGGDGDSECSENKTKKMGTKRGHEEIENDAREQMGTCHSAQSSVPDETSSLEADGGSQTTKRAKIDQMPLNVYEQQRLERIRENDKAGRLPNFRLHWRLALLRTRAPNPSALPMCRICCSSCTG
jgi:hypothetical protein